MRTLASLALVALLPACASLQYDPDSFESVAPFEAWLLPNDDRLGFTLSEPAHVAVFEIVPGSGVSLLYPSYGYQERMLDAGMHHPIIGQVRGRWYYQDVGYRYSSYQLQPRIVYLLACRSPMEITHLRLSPGLIRSSLGLRYYESMDPWTTIDLLTALAVPSAADQENCVGDVYYDHQDRGAWGGAYAYEVPYHRVICEDGSVISVPYYVSPARACAGRVTRGTTTRRQPDTTSTTPRESDTTAATPRQPDTIGVTPRVPRGEPNWRGDSTLVEPVERPRVRRMWEEEERRPREAPPAVEEPSRRPRVEEERLRSAPRGERRGVEPRPAQPRSTETRSTGSRRPERTTEPRRSEPRRSEPRKAEPRSKQPRSPEPRSERPNEETKRERQPLQGR